MGREVRRVTKDWKHPENERGRLKPLFEGYASAKAKFEAKQAKDGLQEALDYFGHAPDVYDYMPDWPEAEKTHLMMYENTTEGTPISPAFETPEELARWLADNKASAFGGMTATYEQWLATAKAGWAPSMVMMGGDLVSGVESSKP